MDRYYNKATGTEIFANPRVPAHLLYDAGSPDHVTIDEANPYFHAIPAGLELNFDIDNIPTVLTAIPDYDINLAKAGKVEGITEEFAVRSTADGINIVLDEARSNLTAYGEATTPSAVQTRFYANIAAADAGIATVNAYVDINDVNNFDVPTDVSWSA